MSVHHMCTTCAPHVVDMLSHPHRLYDLPNSELMKHWDKTYTFLKEAK